MAITELEAAQAANLLIPQWRKALVAVQGNDVLPATPAGILEQIIGQGVETLSDKQRFVYLKEIAPVLTEKCGTINCPTMVIAGVSVCDCCEVRGL